jgi:L-2-hydroxyglutarate oxidase LhgO
LTAGAAVEAAVVGAGVVGLAVARELAAAGFEPLILERNGRIGEETSSRNSGVIHSGIYYPPGGLKARLCARGREETYAYCAARGIAHRRCGKLVVAQESQVGALRRLHAQGNANGVPDLQWLDADAVRRLEPGVRCAAALHSPHTGIVDVHELMLALQADCESAGATVVLRSPVERLRAVDTGIELTVGGEVAERIVARRVVNAAGLGAIDVARRTEGYPAERLPGEYFAKGHYFSVGGRPFGRLVYPMPNDAGLGIHATVDLDGSVKFGPDVQWVDRLDYTVPAERSGAFYAAIREYWPGLPDGALSPAYAGIRPKIAGPGEPAADFVIEGPTDHGIGGLVNLFGIESPGLTAALALGAQVAAMLR